MALNVVMVGPPGSGKGTQASRLAAERGIPHISTGDILRGAVQAGTELGRQAKAVLEAGCLVSDDTMIGIVCERLAKADTKNGFLLDGFPRTVPQAQALEKMLVGYAPLLVIDLSVPDEELVHRLLRRRVCGQCGTVVSTSNGGLPETCERCGGQLVTRSDDSEVIVRKRLAVYRQETQPLVDFYRSRPHFRVVDGRQVPDAVTTAVGVAIDEAMVELDEAGGA